MSVVTMRAAGQNGGQRTVVVGSVAPTISGALINVLQLPLDVVFPVDRSPPLFSSPASRANNRNSALMCINVFLAGVRFLLLSSSLARLREPLLLVLILPVAFRGPWPRLRTLRRRRRADTSPAACHLLPSLPRL